ncbi:hypothetical protein ACVWWO_005827 [Bradyrhizobium sp. F1.13.1]
MGHKRSWTGCLWQVGYGSWLRENARTLGGDRTSYSLKTIFAVERESALNLESELKNVILARFRSWSIPTGS